MNAETVKRISVRQIGSQAGANGRVKATLQALGLGKIGKVKEHNFSDPIRGMVKKVSNLVEVEIIS